jgi:hypothetical protein
VNIIEMEFIDNLPDCLCAMWYSIPQAEGKRFNAVSSMVNTTGLEGKET